MPGARGAIAKKRSGWRKTGTTDRVDSMNDDHERAETQRMVRGLFSGVVPERDHELDEIWNRHGVIFHLVEDPGRDCGLVMEAGPFQIIRYSQRILCVFWLASYAAWEGYVAVQAEACTGLLELTRFREILDCVQAVYEAERPEDIAFPHGVPMPGDLEDINGDFAIFSTAWAFFHEVRHAIHSKDGTSTISAQEPEERRQEEFSCDDHATRFMLEDVRRYSDDTSQEFSLVMGKRQIGIHYALFALTLIGRNSWDDGDFHPAIQRRIDAVLDVLQELGISKAAALVSITAFQALGRAFPGAPNPLEKINQVATRENWSPESDLFHI